MNTPTNPLPTSLAGYQLLCDSEIRADDLCVPLNSMSPSEWEWAGGIAGDTTTAEGNAEFWNFRVYRLIPVPKPSDHDEPPGGKTFLEERPSDPAGLRRAADEFRAGCGRDELRGTPGDALPDSGQRRAFTTGAVRDASPGKGHFHSIPPVALRKLAKRFEDGARKYAKNNWMKGIPLSAFQDSLQRHLLQFSEGDATEDHAGAIVWNACAMVWTDEEIKAGRLPASLDDLPYRPNAKRL